MVLCDHAGAKSKLGGRPLELACPYRNLQLLEPHGLNLMPLVPDAPLREVLGTIGRIALIGVGRIEIGRAHV